MEPNRLKELSCVIFGHDWSQTGSHVHTETGIVLSHFKQCANCNLRIVDESGYLRLIKPNSCVEQTPSSPAPEQQS